jgi:hypothetical protein
VNVIGGAVDDDRRALQFTDNAAHVCVQLVLQVRFDEGRAVFRAENYMRQEIRVRVGHFFRPSGAIRDFCGARFPRLAPWAKLCRPFQGLNTLAVQLRF